MSNNTAKTVRDEHLNDVEAMLAELTAKVAEMKSQQNVNWATAGDAQRLATALRNITEWTK